MLSCAFLTIQDRAGWVIDDDLVKGPLRKLGWQVQDVAWDAARVDWDAFDVVVIRSTWDYQHQLDSFLDVLQEIEISSALLLNTMETAKWNAQKDYLFGCKRPVCLWCPLADYTHPAWMNCEQPGVPWVPPSWLSSHWLAPTPARLFDGIRRVLSTSGRALARSFRTAHA